MKYWLFQSNQVLGPYGPDDLSGLASFSAESLVCPEGRRGTTMGDWQRAGMVPDLSVALVQASEKHKGRAPVATLAGLPAEPTLKDLAQLGSLQEKMAMMETAVLQLQESLRVKDAELAALHQELAEKDKESFELKKTADSAHADAAEARTHADALQSDVESRRQEAEQLKLESAAFKEQIASLEERVAEVRRFGETLDKAVEAEKKVEHDVDAHGATLGELSREIESLRAQMLSAPANIPPPGAGAPSPFALSSAPTPAVVPLTAPPPSVGPDLPNMAPPSSPSPVPTPAPMPEPSPFAPNPALAPLPAAFGGNVPPPSPAPTPAPAPTPEFTAVPAFDPLTPVARPVAPAAESAPTSEPAKAAPSASSKKSPALVVAALLLAACGGYYYLMMNGRRRHAPPPVAPVDLPTSPSAASDAGKPDAGSGPSAPTAAGTLPPPSIGTPSSAAPEPGASLAGAPPLEGGPGAANPSADLRQDAIDAARGWKLPDGRTLGAALESLSPPVGNQSPWRAEPQKNGPVSVTYLAHGGPGAPTVAYEFNFDPSGKSLTGSNPAATALLRGETAPPPAPAKSKVHIKRRKLPAAKPAPAPKAPESLDNLLGGPPDAGGPIEEPASAPKAPADSPDAPAAAKPSAPAKSQSLDDLLK